MEHASLEFCFRLTDVRKDGVFDAIKAGVLDKMQLSIILDKDKPSNVIESYTFNFKYSQRRLDGMVLSSEHGQPITLKDARTSLATLTRYLLHLTQGLPDLPRELLQKQSSTDSC